MKRIMIVIGIFLVICLLFIIFNTNKHTECTSFTGGGFEIIFNTNGGNEIESMHRCIACSPDSYEDLPIPVKSDYTFDGWYYDKDLKKKVDGNNSLDITPKRKLDKKGCHIGYKEITLYAKWIK